jgi:hypothetical protein
MTKAAELDGNMQQILASASSNALVQTSQAAVSSKDPGVFQLLWDKGARDQKRREAEIERAARLAALAHEAVGFAAASSVAVELEAEEVFQAIAVEKGGSMLARAKTPVAIARGRRLLDGGLDVINDATAARIAKTIRS